VSRKTFNPSETVEEKRIRIINQRDERIAFLHKTVRRLRRENRNLRERIWPLEPKDKTL